MSTYLSRPDLDIDLGKYFLVLRRRWFPAVCVFGTATAAAMLFAVLQEPSYQASGKLLVKLDRTPSLAGLDVPGQKSIGEPDAIGLQSDPIATEVETIRSLEVVKDTIAVLELENDLGESLSPEDFFKGLEVKPIPGTDMIRVGYEQTDPELAATVVNTLIEVYRNNNIATKQAEAIAAREFITKQLPATEAAVRQAESRLREFKEDNQIVVLGEESLETVRAIQLLENEITQARAQLSVARARSNDLQQRLGMDPARALKVATLSQSAAIQDTFAEIRVVQNQIDLAESRYRSTHPTLASLERHEAELYDRLQERVSEAIGVGDFVEGDLQIGQLEQELIANLLQSEIEYVGLTNRIDELNRSRTAQNRRASDLPRLEETQRELERQLAVAQSTYESLLQRLQDVQVAQNQTIDNIRVVSTALVPENPTSSKKILVMAGALVGSMLAVVAAFSLDIIDRSVKTTQETAELLNYPILGALPKLKSSEISMLQSKDSATHTASVYRMLQATIDSISTRSGGNSIAVTSAVHGEGCSHIAANLAAAFARAGKKVLLVDLNLQKPGQCALWHSSSDHGVTQVLADGGLDKAIQNIAPNLFLLSVGNSPRTSLTAFSKKSISSLVSEASGKFDFVIVDSPPITQSADSSLIGEIVDSNLVVVRLGQAKEVDVKAAKELLELSRQNVMGVIVNGVEKASNPNEYFAYTAKTKISTVENPSPTGQRLPRPIPVDAKSPLSTSGKAI